MTTGFVAVDGGQLYYEVAGNGPALVLIHAGIADSRMWDPQWAEFAQHCTVVRYDVRGYGKSPTEPIAFSNRADVAALLDHLAIERATLLGVSRGGQIAGDFALEFPHRVSGLILECAGLSGFTYEPTEADAAMMQLEEQLEPLWKAKEWAQLADLEVHLWVDGPGQAVGRAPAALREQVREMIYANYTNHHGDEKPQPLVPPAAERLHEIQVPTLVIIGDLDTGDSLATAEALAQGIAGAQKVVFAQTAHLPNMEQPARFNQTVLDFLHVNQLAQ